MEKPLCISYIRFSSITQSEGSSLERQLELSRAYAKEHGLVLDDKLSYRDLGKSAYTGEHVRSGGLGIFLDAIDQGKIPKGSVLLVESLDRLSRENVLDAFGQFQRIINEEIKIVTLCDKVEYTRENLSNDFSKLLISLSIMMRSNEESKRKSERICAAWRMKREKLLTSDTILTSKCPGWLKITADKNRFEIIPERVELIKRIFELSYSGLGIKAIARTLNAEKIPPFKSKQGWCQSSNH